MSLDGIYLREPGIIARRIAGETILVPITRHAGEMGLFTLNEVGTFVWERLDGERSLASITDDVVACFEVNEERAAADLETFAERLTEAGCAREVSPTPASSRVSRTSCA